jgi:hypothetical protein
MSVKTEGKGCPRYDNWGKEGQGVGVHPEG